MKLATGLLVFFLGAIYVHGDLCTGKSDGKYPLRDTFKYLLCHYGHGHIVPCPTNQVYINREQKCRTVTEEDKSSFCRGLPNNDYRNPWNCHKFFKCYDQLTYDFDCQRADLVFNPENDQCVYSYQYKCTVVTSDFPAKQFVEFEKLLAPSEANPCTGRPDGNYVIPDVFRYLQCKSGVASYHSCPENQIFIASKKACGPAAPGAEDTFCIDRADGNYRNPWNCHRFISCVAGHPVYDRPCHPLSLVYDPNNDRCEYERIFACKNITGSAPPKTDQCKGKADGKYVLSDVFKYLVCKSRIGTIVFCPVNQVYVASEQKCRVVSIADKKTFCTARPTGNYRNPWNCHNFLTCAPGHPVFDRSCYPNDLVYDADNDRCEHSYLMPCVEVQSALQTSFISTSRCTGQPDGLYVIPDVFKYLECKSGAEMWHDCPKDQIFVATTKKCSIVTTAHMDIFCDGRADGNYRNPWNCHHFISCATGHRVYDRLCNPTSLVYDPYNDRCEYKEKFPCVEISTSPGPKPSNRCTGKPDGLYILSDVFKYLECKGGQEILHFCPKKQIFVPNGMKCRAVTQADRVTFCDGRPEGNYRNPWNCHHFITCATGHPVYDRPCHPLSLVFDPDNDKCEYDTVITCEEV